jgi:hypothetical protein
MKMGFIQVATQGFLLAYIPVGWPADPSLTELRSILEQCRSFGFTPGLFTLVITHWQLEKNCLIFPMVSKRGSFQAGEVGQLSQRMYTVEPLLGLATRMGLLVHFSFNHSKPWCPSRLFFFPVGLGFELRASHVQSWCSTT